MTLVEGDPEVRQVPVVILTPSREEQDLTRCYRLGAIAYIVSRSTSRNSWTRATTGCLLGDAQRATAGLTYPLLNFKAAL